MTRGNPKGRFLSHEECIDLHKRARGFGIGGGSTEIYLDSIWTGNLRWARNRITTSGDVRVNDVRVIRWIRGAPGMATIDQIDNHHLEAAVRRAERLLKRLPEQPEDVLSAPYMEPYKEPKLWFDRTYNLNAAARADAMRIWTDSIEKSGMLAAGYIEVSAQGRTRITESGINAYYPFTWAQYSITVRDPKGTGSGWAGVDWNDWGRIDGTRLSEVALEKCLTARNPVAIEPGRYTAILEPQATYDIVRSVVGTLNRLGALSHTPDRHPYAGEVIHTTRIGQQIVDARITISADPMDPECGFPPFRSDDVYHPVTWIERGVLKHLAYQRRSGIRDFGVNTGLPNSGSFTLHGGTASIPDMIASTTRGILVTRFSEVEVIHQGSLLSTGYTRDGLWLIENGKISKPIKNFRFTESPLFMLNNLIEIGKPIRIFNPGEPVVVPPIMVQDFSFTSLADAV